MRSESLFRAVGAALLVFSIVPLGTATFVLGFGLGESPCILCWAQRTTMTLLGLCAVLVLRYGPRPRYLGTAFLLCAAGLFMALRHSALHLARDVGQGFSAAILGVHTYVWSGVVFWAVLVAMAVLLLLVREGDQGLGRRDLGALGQVAVTLYLVAVAGNLVQALASTGPPPYLGQSDPVRFSLDPRHWVWSLEEYRPAPISLRGRWDVEPPGLDGLDPDPGHGPLGSLRALTPSRRTMLGFPYRGRPGDLAYDPATDRFLVATDAWGVHVVDGTLAREERHAVVDPAFSVDLTPFHGAAFLDGGELMALSTNKSFVVLRPAEVAHPSRNFRFFTEGLDRFEEVSRSRFATVRARMGYVMSLAWWPERRALYTVTVPGRRYRRPVVSRFDRADLTLSAEWALAVDPGAGLEAVPGRSLDDLYPTAATFDRGRLLALSAAYDTLLVVDPDRGTVVDALALPGLTRPVGLAVRGGELVVLEQGGGVAWLPWPPPGGAGAVEGAGSGRK